MTWLVAAYLAAVVASLGLLLAAWRRRASARPTEGEPPALDVYELARLARGNAGVAEILLIKALGDGTVARDAGWGRTQGLLRSRRLFRIVSRRPAGSDAHPLEQRLARAARTPDEWPGNVGREVVARSPDVLDERLVALGLLHDDMLGRWAARVCWSLFWIGALWAIGLVFVDEGTPLDDVRWLAIVASPAVLMPALRLLLDDEPQPTPDGRQAVDRARDLRPPSAPPASADDLLLAIALHGPAALQHAARSCGDYDLGARLVEARHVREYFEYEHEHAW